METHVVQPILLTLLHYLQPLLLVGWRIARFGEAAVLHRAAQKQRSPVNEKLAVFDADVAQAKVRFVNIVAGIDGQVVEVRMVFVPWFNDFLYFIMIRPQRKEQGRVKDMLSSLEVGDTVCTTSGFYGMVIDIPDEFTVIVEFGNNKNCRIVMKKEAIAQVEKPEEATEKETKK